MNKINSIAIDRDKYKTESEFNAIVGKVVGLLLELDYVIVSRYEDAGVYVVEFMPNHPEYGDYMPYWLLPEEEETVEYKEYGP